jgi:hypothetical protein
MEKFVESSREAPGFYGSVTVNVGGPNDHGSFVRGSFVIFSFTTL